MPLDRESVGTPIGDRHGLDVGKHVAEVAIREPGRGTRSGGRISASQESLRAYAATLGTDDQVVLEAATDTWAIVEVLERHAGRVVVSNPPPDPGDRGRQGEDRHDRRGGRAPGGRLSADGAVWTRVAQSGPLRT